MNRLTLIPLAFLLMLLPAAPSFAKHKGKDNYRNAAESDYRYGKGLRHAARTLEKTTWATFKRAKRINDHPTKAERRALKNLRRLHVEAREFRIATEEHRRLRPIVADFRDLNHAFHKAARKFHKLDTNRKTRRSFRDTARVMDRIEDRFEPVIARVERRENRRYNDRYASVTHRRHNDRWGR